MARERIGSAIIQHSYFFRMDDATLRRLVNVACPVALIITIYDLTQALNHLENWAIAVTLFMIAVVAVAWLVAATEERAPI
jgi:hypothetical protein